MLRPELRASPGGCKRWWYSNVFPSYCQAVGPRIFPRAFSHKGVGFPRRFVETKPEIVECPRYIRVRRFCVFLKTAECFAHPQQVSFGNGRGRSEGADVLLLSRVVAAVA